MFNWSGYINATKNKPPRRLLVQASEYVKNREAALDLGAGALNESKYLLDSGFKKVIAVDNEENLDLIKEVNSSAFIFKKAKVEDYDFPKDEFDLINAQFVLPFIEKEKVGKVMASIKNSLKKEGIFVGQFFGLKDAWNNHAGICVYSKKEIEDLLSGLDIIYIQEEERDGQTALDGEKHWHIINFIAQNKF